jgi:hypothetical protein
MEDNDGSCCDETRWDGSGGRSVKKSNERVGAADLEAREKRTQEGRGAREWKAHCAVERRTHAR